MVLAILPILTSTLTRLLSLTSPPILLPFPTRFPTPVPMQDGGGSRDNYSVLDSRVPLCEILRCSGVPWCARAVSRQVRHELEANRTHLRVKWTQNGASSADPQRLRAMLDRLPQLKSLDATRCPPSHLSAVAVPQVTHLVLGNNRNIYHLEPLRSCVSLRSLDVGDCKRLHDIDALAEYTSLCILDCGGCPLDDLSALRSCRSLTEVYLDECDSEVYLEPFDVSPLGSCTTLKHLDLSQAFSIEDISALSALRGLETLRLRWCQSIGSLDPLAYCTSLRTMDCFGSSIGDQKGMSSCLKLTDLDVGSTDVVDLTPLASCPSLTKLAMGNCSSAILSYLY